LIGWKIARRQSSTVEPAQAQAPYKAREISRLPSTKAFKAIGGAIGITFYLRKS
jgi:hypothetical protein